jgi:Dolichyl-phosphate-mannose-protein mannosyltransferase
VLFILLAFGLRLLNAEMFSFWTDEGLTPLRSGYTVPEILSNQVIIQEGVTNDTHPPFFFLILHFSRMVLGETDFAFRYPSLLASVLLLPLLAKMGQRMGGRRLGMVVALLTAVNPLQIWYANEARMYTLAVLLVTAASYVLWRLLAQANTVGKLPTPMLVRHLLLYIVLAGLAFYTHYFAVFLIMGQAVFWVLLLWRQGHKRLLAGTAVLALLIALPLIPFTIPRLFTAAEANYYTVSPWIILQDVVRFFALGRTADFQASGIILLNVGAFLLLLAGLWHLKRGWQPLFLLIWLLVVPVGLIIGSLVFKPMYQGVRHIMLGSPAFLLLLAWGILFLRECWLRAKKQPRLLWGLGLMAGLAVVTVGPIISLNNYYNGRFGKDDFRSLIEFVEARAGDNDVIVYNNAILLPLHEHYQQRADLAVTASPIYPKYANSSPAQLTELSQKYDRIWFVTDPPADGRDANGTVQQWLDTNLLLLGSTFFEANTVEVRVRVYDTRATNVTTLPTNGRSLNIQWPNYPQLVGMAWQVAEPVTQPAIWVDLFWQGEPPSETAGLLFQLAGADGRLDWQKTEATVSLNNQSWLPNSINRRSYVISLPNGTPPGRYTMLLQPQERSETPQLLAEPISIAEIVVAADTNIRPDWPVGSAQAIFKNGVVLQTVALTDKVVRPGHTLPITLLWQIDSQTALTDLQYELTITAKDDTILRNQIGLPGANWLTQWQPSQLLREPSGIYFPPDTPAGSYSLQMQLTQANELVAGRPFWWPIRSESVPVGTVEVIPWPLETSLPQNVTRVDAQFGDAIQLYGYDLAADPDSLQLTLYWQALAVPANNWLVFVHLLNESGEIVAQQDVIPAEGLRPTQGWRISEVITDMHQMPLPPDLGAGRYTVVVGLFEPDSFIRPFVRQNNLPQADNQLPLTGISLP